MSQLRPFTLLGVPACAARIVGEPGSFALSRVASVAATNAAGKESLITLTSDAQFSLLREREWSIKKSALVAQHGASSVVAAEGGAYRVDIGEGSHFLCDPKKVLGTLGVVRSRIVYNETRLDILRAWSRMTWHYTTHALRSTYTFLRHWGSKVPLPQRLKALDVPRLPAVPDTTKQYWQKTKYASRRLWDAAAARSFDYTHPPRLEVEGPCSVLIRP